MPDVSDRFDVLALAQNWTARAQYERREVLAAMLKPLPLRASVAVAVRCEKRIAPLKRVQPLIAEATSAGVGSAQLKPLLRYAVRPVTAAGDTASAASSSAAHAASAANPIHDTIDAIIASADACSEADLGPLPAVRAAVADIATVRALGLGAPGELGLPVRWDDPRLGPLWPNGEPEWYTEVVAACADLEAQLRRVPDTSAPPTAADAPDATCADREWLDQLKGAGKLVEYRGQYVIAAEKSILAHGRRLADVRSEAERTARAKNIPVDRFVLSFVPGRD